MVTSGRKLADSSYSCNDLWHICTYKSWEASAETMVGFFQINWAIQRIALQVLAANCQRLAFRRNRLCRSLYKYSSLMFIYIALSTVSVQGAGHDKIYPTFLPGIRPGLSNKTYTSKEQPTHPKPSHIIINIRSFQITLRTTHPTIQPFPRSSVYA